MIAKIISGGQAGADRAALDVAIKKNIPHGGWIPNGRIAEDGPLPLRYHLQEMPTSSYPDRTKQNVLDSDGTLILSHGELTGGSALTLELARYYATPYLHLDMDSISVAQAAQLLTSWIYEKEIKVINIAGARASGDPAIYQVTTAVLDLALGG